MLAGKGGVIGLDNAGFEILDRTECVALLSTVALGRVAVSIDALPAIFPVNFCVLANDVLFRTGAGTKLTAALLGTVVAFEADWVDQDTEEAWSVQLVGRANMTDAEADRAAADRAGLHSWAPVPRRHLVRITSVKITGRRLPAVGTAPQGGG
jgi:uncharacterized protein